MTSVNVTPYENRITSRYLTPFEKDQALTERIKQLQKGSEPMLLNYEGYTHIQIAQEELKQGLLSMIYVKRAMPSGYYEIIPVNELISQ